MHSKPITYFDPHHQRNHSRYNYTFSALFYWGILLWNHYILKKRVVKIEPWISMSWGQIEHNNWGDDINIFFLSKISSDCLLPGHAYANPEVIYFRSLPGSPSVYLIGSILHLIRYPNSIVWGSGLVNESLLPTIQPLHILAVRGPLTRKVLTEHGYDCPAVYGDPALLLPYYYFPKNARKKYRIGFIPHYVDEDKEELVKFTNDYSVKIIHMSGYKGWKTVIDQILSCEYIVSSSLHGLIIAEAYHIPNLWGEFREPLVGDISRRFKFHDFFQSIGLDREKPYCITHETTLIDLLNQKKYYKKAPGLDLRPLVQVCPFRIKDYLLKRINGK